MAGGHVLVLIADDEEPIAAVLASLIEDLGFTAQIASNGRQALDLARESWPALVVTDLMMPELTGVELIDALRTEATAAGRKPVPVILMTAAGLQHARKAGADAVVAKPFDLDELDALIAHFLTEVA